MIEAGESCADARLVEAWGPGTAKIPTRVDFSFAHHPHSGDRPHDFTKPLFPPFPLAIML
jgi:hypothetical protein